MSRIDDAILDMEWLKNRCKPKGYGGEWQPNMIETFDMAIKALRKQAPVKPLLRQGYPDKGQDTCNGLCPICRTLNVVTIPRYYIANNFGYCEQCGQRLDWRKEREG